MDTEKCKVVLRAIQLGSMLQTSTELGYTPSGISYIIDSVEKDLGIKIVSRNQSGIKLTQAGVRCRPFLEALIDAADDLSNEAKKISEDVAGEFTIGTFPSIGRLLLPDIMEKYLKSHPNITINIVEGINEQLEQMMTRKEVDFLICSARIKGYDWIPLRKDNMVCVMSPESELKDLKNVKAEDLKNEKFIMPAYGRDSDVNELMKRINLNPNIISYTLENSSAFEMVRRNMGITIVNELATVGTTDGLVVKEFNPQQFIIEGVVIKKLISASAEIIDFIEFMKPYITDDEYRYTHDI